MKRKHKRNYVDPRIRAVSYSTKRTAKMVEGLAMFVRDTISVLTTVPDYGRMKEDYDDQRLKF